MQVTLSLITTNADSVVIDWADGFTDNFNTNVNLIIQTHAYADTGHYVVTATAYNKNSCYTDAKTDVSHADTFMCFVPNVFTPNNDLKNETFQPVVSYCKSYELFIFDRWGGEVYHTNYTAGQMQQPGWNGEGSSEGTYLYILTITDGDFKRYNLKGTVMLLR